MTKEKDKKFYQKRGFWISFTSAVAGVVAGSMGAVEAVTQVITAIFGG